MPKLSDDEIKARIADGSLTAVTLDTSIFDRYGCNLDFALLRNLIQFKAGKVTVLFSDVIVSEVSSHIAEKAAETQSAVNQAIKRFSKVWKTTPAKVEVEKVLNNGRNPGTFAQESISDFLKDVEGQVVPAAGDKSITEEVMRRYFAGETPFENRQEKKSEFPDAFALVSLNQVFAQRRQYLLCVSNDKGWEAFCEQSEWLIFTRDLDVALSYFHDTGRNTADNVIASLKKGTAEALISHIELSIQARLDDHDFEAETHSGLDYEAEPASASLQSVYYETLSNPIITDANDDEVSFTIKVEALVLFEAYFTFYAYDSIDKDYVTLAAEYAEAESRHSFKLVVTVSRVLDPEPVPVSVDVVKDCLEVNFGYVEPFANEDPTHEKY